MSCATREEEEASEGHRASAEQPRGKCFLFAQIVIIYSVLSINKLLKKIFRERKKSYTTFYILYIYFCNNLFQKLILLNIYAYVYMRMCFKVEFKKFNVRVKFSTLNIYYFEHCFNSNLMFVCYSIVAASWLNNSARCASDR